MRGNERGVLNQKVKREKKRKTVNHVLFFPVQGLINERLVCFLLFPTYLAENVPGLFA
jgi:hypothetical protein